VAVGADVTPEELGDRVRAALGADADKVEEVAVVSETAPADLPAAARARLGIGDGQKNVLLRVVLRRLDRALVRDEANALRDAVHACLHEGAAVPEPVG
jgi:phenylalanyl-tRNA synthetase alpha chain